MVIGKLGHFVFVDGRDARPVRAVQLLARGSGGVRIVVNERGRRRGERGGVCAFVFREARQAGAIECGAIELAFDWRFFRGREVHDSLGFVHRVERSDFPFALGDLPELLAVAIVKIKMSVAASLAGPQESLAVPEKIQLVADIDPGCIFFGQCHTR